MAADRRGFALIVVVVTLAVMLILATVITVNTAGGRQRERVLSASSALRRFRSEVGAQGNAPSFIQDLNDAPGQLSHLYVKLTNQDRNSCGAIYGNNEINNWRGPYHLIPMLRNAEYQIEPGLVASDTLRRAPANAGGQQPGVLSIVLRNVQLELAQDLGFEFDGITTGAGPTITFTPNGTAPIEVLFNIDILGC